jgi:hypothetical protein
MSDEIYEIAAKDRNNGFPNVSSKWEDPEKRAELNCRDLVDDIVMNLAS